jgi:hypothetical protein
MTERIDSPATRSRITLALAKKPRWHGVRDHIRLLFAIDSQPDLEGRRIHWTARFPTGQTKSLYEGCSSTVAEALDEIAIIKHNQGTQQ